MSTTPTVSNNSNTLSAEVLQEIQTRVDRVNGYLKQSTSVWLSVAREFFVANQALSQHAYERFINDTGFTKSVADKLVLVGKKKCLYAEDKLAFISTVDGWTTLYELTKLEDKKIDQLIDDVKSGSVKRITRDLVANVVNNRPIDDKTLVLATIEMSSSVLQTITVAQSKLIASKLAEIDSVLSAASKIVAYRKRDTKLSEVAEAATANSVVFAAGTKIAA
jgi:hypothetical protein